jgi:hypothetical protein
MTHTEGFASSITGRVGGPIGPIVEKQIHSFTWPLSKGVTAEVRLSGPEVKPAHLEMLREYLQLAKKALESDADASAA